MENVMDTEYLNKSTDEKSVEIHRFWETDRRYYSAHLVKDLFGEWIIDKHWGGKFNRHRRFKGELCSSYQDGILKIEKLTKVRKKHKYRVV